QAALDVNRDIVVGVRPGRIVDPYRLLTGTFRKRNLWQRQAKIGRAVGHREDFPRARDRAGGDLRRGKFGFGKRLIHRFAPFERSGGRRVFGAGFARSFRPFAGMTRIRFKGSPRKRSLSSFRSSPRNSANLGAWARVSTRV